MTDGMRIHVIIRPEVDKILQAYQDRAGVTRTEAIRRAVQLLGMVEDVQNDGGTLFVEHRGVVRELRVL